jgi:hypothetical protein
MTAASALVELTATKPVVSRTVAKTNRSFISSLLRYSV